MYPRVEAWAGSLKERVGYYILSFIHVLGTPWLESLLTFDYVLPGKASLRLRSEKQANRVGDVGVGLGIIFMI